MDYVLLGFMIFLSLLMLLCLWMIRKFTEDIDRMNGYCLYCGQTVDNLQEHITTRHTGAP